MTAAPARPPLGWLRCPSSSSARSVGVHPSGSGPAGRWPSTIQNTTQTRPIAVMATNAARQPTAIARNPTTGPDNAAPSGVPAFAKLTALACWRCGNQFRTILLKVEPIGPSPMPNSDADHQQRADAPGKAVRPQKIDQAVIDDGHHRLRAESVRRIAADEAERGIAEREAAEHDAQLRRIELQVADDERGGDAERGTIEVVDHAGQEHECSDRPNDSERTWVTFPCFFR